MGITLQELADLREKIMTYMSFLIIVVV